MKHIFLATLAAAFSLSVHAQDPAPAIKGVTYGAGATAEKAISVNDPKLSAEKYTGKISGKVVEVCQEKGCWMKIEKADGDKMMVKFKDYGFFMPKDIVGKEVVLDGETIAKEVSVQQLRHYAEDAGKSQEEINKITKPRKETQFIAKGVLVL
jgi:hypothetical protein